MATIRESQGFTLIEMAIVITICGLIIGGVLVGRDLIRGSGVQATITQIDKYNSAALAFSDKYGGLPGDLQSTKAQTFSLYYCGGSLSNTIGCGNGDGSIQGWNASPWIDGTNFAGEVAMFFLHLSQAGLIDGSYGMGPDVSLPGVTTTGGSYSTGSSPPRISSASSHVEEMLPEAKIGNHNYITVGEWQNINYYIITGVTKLTANADLTTTNSISPQDAYALDLKMDDGLPGNGRVFALDTVTNTLSGSGNGQDINTFSANNCVNGTGTAYNTANSTYTNALLCSLRIQMAIY